MSAQELASLVERLRAFDLNGLEQHERETIAQAVSALQAQASEPLLNTPELASTDTVCTQMVNDAALHKGALPYSHGQTNTRLLPGPICRVETGNLKFGDDWTGAFIRGDNCFHFATCLRNLLDGNAGVFDRSALEGLYQTLCATREDAALAADG